MDWYRERTVPVRWAAFPRFHGSRRPACGPGGVVRRDFGREPVHRHTLGSGPVRGRPPRERGSRYRARTPRSRLGFPQPPLRGNAPGTARRHSRSRRQDLFPALPESTQSDRGIRDLCRCRGKSLVRMRAGHLCLRIEPCQRRIRLGCAAGQLGFHHRGSRRYLVGAQPNAAHRVAEGGAQVRVAGCGLASRNPQGTAHGTPGRHFAGADRQGPGTAHRYGRLAVDHASAGATGQFGGGRISGSRGLDLGWHDGDRSCALDRLPALGSLEGVRRPVAR